MTEKIMWREVKRLEALLAEASAENTSLREQLRLAQERWISVKERLPNEFGYVLIAQANHLDPEDGITSSYVNINYQADEMFVHADEEVTHWMPSTTTYGRPVTAISNLERNREAIGQALERMFNVIAEEPVSFVLWVWVEGEQIQVSNADRGEVVEVLRRYLGN